MKDGFPYSPVNYVHIPIHVASAGSGQAAPQDPRQCTGACACGFGIILIMVAGIFLLSMPSISQEFYYLLLIGLGGGVILLLGGITVLRKSTAESRKVAKIIAESDEISLESISRATGVSVSRVRVLVGWAIAAKIVKGRIIEDRYVSKLTAERIDDSTVRCPHCQAELELSDEF